MNMNTNKITKVILATVAVTGLSFVGLTQIHANYLPMLGVGVSYLAALVILALAAFDNGRARHQS